jgi:hypothetical protein
MCHRHSLSHPYRLVESVFETPTFRCAFCRFGVMLLRGLGCVLNAPCTAAFTRRAVSSGLNSVGLSGIGEDICRSLIWGKL